MPNAAAIGNGARPLWQRWGPELALAIVAGWVFLGFLGSVDLWGKREQRAAAEALDTVDHDRWLVAQIQGRPRLEKPPLPRWIVASLLAVTGRRDEWVVRLPSALGALAMVGLVYGLGRRMAGRAAGLSAGFALASLAYFITQVRQAGNDGPLAFFTTLALYAAWRRLHDAPLDTPPAAPAEQVGPRKWLFLFYGALGCGFLTKGPVILLLAGLTLLPYLALARRLRPGLGALTSGWGALLFLGLALCWPVPVLLAEPRALGVWLLEMGQKAGAAGIEHHDTRPPLALEWFWMALPWTPLGIVGIVMPFTRRNSDLRPWYWFAWMWAYANLLMFCFWKVAKPNYYVPCLPGVALTMGVAWVRLCERARFDGVGALRLIQAHWAVAIAAGCITPVAVAQLFPEYLTTAAVLGVVLAVAGVASYLSWREGRDALSFGSLVAALALGVVVVYGRVAPPMISGQSQRALASQVERMLPSDETTVMFFDELDEGLWFYLRGRELQPVPGSQPQFNHGFDLVQEAKSNQLVRDPKVRIQRSQALLLDWIRDPERPARYLLIRSNIYDAFAPSLTGLVTPIYREDNLKRNEVVLLRVESGRVLATRAAGAEQSVKR